MVTPAYPSLRSCEESNFLANHGLIHGSFLSFSLVERGRQTKSRCRCTGRLNRANKLVQSLSTEQNRISFCFLFSLAYTCNSAKCFIRGTRLNSILTPSPLVSTQIVQSRFSLDPYHGSSSSPVLFQHNSAPERSNHNGCNCHDDMKFSYQIYRNPNDQQVVSK